MKSPFPGMDPYLEAPDIWPDFHERLATVMSEMLNEQLPAPYYSRLQMRSEMGVILAAGTTRSIVPDVVVARDPQSDATSGGQVAVVTEPRTEVSQGIELRVRTDPIRHQFVEIRDAARNHALVTVIEIVSPSNKKPGADRRAYESKQRDILDSQVNLVELDLLRDGQRLLPYPDLDEVVHQSNCDYLILVNRAKHRTESWIDYILYPVTLPAPLPCIPVPLAGDDLDIPLDLQIALQTVYQRALYQRVIDYSVQPSPPLDEAHVSWADELLRAANLRHAKV